MTAPIRNHKRRDTKSAVGLSRRQFLETSAMAGIFAASGRTATAFDTDPPVAADARTLRIGWIADLHYGWSNVELSRLEAFMAECSKRELDFIIQGGDFFLPRPASKDLMRLWEQFHGDRFHVLGNHDMDETSKEEMMAFWGMKKKHYSFDRGGFHFVVLDCNYLLSDGKYVDFANGNYFSAQQPNRDLINPEQIEWLRQDLAGTILQTIIVSHQGLDEVWDGWSSPSRFEVRNVIKEANAKAGFQKVIACFCGHHHVDEHAVIEDVHYIQINSASFYRHPESCYTAPLFAFVTIDPAGQIRIEGRRSEFVPPTPKEARLPYADRVKAIISDRRLVFTAKLSVKPQLAPS